jgi:hypothetical protein
VSCIKKWAGESADEEQEVALYGTNPGNRGWCIRTEEMDFIEPLICTECVDDTPEVTAVNKGSCHQLLWTNQVFIRTKKQPATWNHASTPPSGAFSKLVSVKGAGSVDTGTVPA